MYTVRVEDRKETREHRCDTRRGAIRKAKALSRRTWVPIRVRDDAERERMVYRDGELDYYEYDVRRRRKV